jgi:putative ABC transport system permease protein
MTSGLGTPSLLGRHLRSGFGASVVVAIIVAVAVFAVALAPRALERLGTDELRTEFAAQSPALLDLSGTGRIGLVAGMPDPSLDDLVGPTDAAIGKVDDHIPLPLADGASPAIWLLRTKTHAGALPQPTNLVAALKLAFDLRWDERIRFVDGSPPVPWTGDELDPESPPIEIAVSRGAAEMMKVSVGDTIGSDPAELLIAGIYDLNDADDPYWVHASDLATGLMDVEAGKPPTVRASVYIAPETLIGLQTAYANGDLAAWIPIDPTAYEYADIAQLAAQTRESAATQVSLPSFGVLNIRSGLSDVVERVQARVASTSALLALTSSGLLGLLFAVFALGMQIVIRRRRGALALASARGAGTLQVRGTMLIEGLLIAVPGSAIASAAAALLLPTRVGPDAWVLPIAVAAAPALLAAGLTTPRALSEGRSDLRVRSSSPGRWVAEIAVVALAGIAVLLLARRGLVEASAAVGTDPLLAATPLLLAVAACVIALRLYPVPLRGAQRLLRRRTGPSGFVGSARAIRDPALGVIASVALVVGIFVVVFSAVMSSTVDAGLIRAARDDVGADVQVRAHALNASVVQQVDALPGVDAAVALTIATGIGFSDEVGPSEVNVLLADTEALHQVRPDIPVLTPTADGRPTMLISSDWVDRVEGADLILGTGHAASAGTVRSDAIPGITRHWVLIDESAAGDIGLQSLVPDRVLVALDPVAPATPQQIDDLVTAAQPESSRGSVSVTDAASQLAESRASPTTSGLRLALNVTAAAALALTLLTVVLASMAAAPARNRLVGILRILGVDRGQLARLLAWELAPVAVMAVVVGTLLGLVVPFLVTGVLDLRVFVGGHDQPGPAFDALWLAASVAVFVGVVVLAGAVAGALGRRFAPAGALKMGEE